MKGKIFINGNIITVDQKETIAEAVVVQGGKISFVGDSAEALEYKGQGCDVIDLQGKTMVPGFIDGHSHFLYSLLMESMTCNLSHPPLGDVNTIEDIVSKLKSFIRERRIKPGKMVMGMGYDESQLKEGRIPTRDDLDKVSTDHSIVITHQSGHVGVLNSRALEKLGVDENTPDPEGGVYGRYEGTNKPNGIAEETAMTNLMMKTVPMPKLWQLGKMLKKGQKLYSSNGITTAQDGGLKKLMLIAYKLAGWFNWIDIDVMGYYFAESADQVKEYMTMKNKGKTRVGRLNLTGIKVMMDGSPQAKTAWLSKPYHVIPEGKPDDYRGYPTIPDESVAQGIFDEVVKNRLQVLAHNNGDEASEQFIRCYEKAAAKHDLKENLRPVMIHAQTVREDQLDRMVSIGMIPSFFQMHTYFWGDWHLDSVLGPERGPRISPTRSAVNRDMKFNVHCDTPVLPPHTSYMLWTAVNRKTRSGRTIGEDQKLTPMEALKTQTIWAAHAYFEEDQKGSLEVGKLADLAILDRDPLTIDHDELKEIVVLETIKEGKTIFKRD